MANVVEQHSDRSGSIKTLSCKRTVEEQGGLSRCLVRFTICFHERKVIWERRKVATRSDLRKKCHFRDFVLMARNFWNYRIKEWPSQVAAQIQGILTMKETFCIYLQLNHVEHSVMYLSRVILENHQHVRWDSYD